MRRSRKESSWKWKKIAGKREFWKMIGIGRSANEDTKKSLYQPNKNQKGQNRTEDDKNQPRTQITSQQQRKNTHSQDEQRQQEEIQEEQSQTQKKRHQKSREQAKSKAVWRPISPPMKRSSSSHQ